MVVRCGRRPGRASSSCTCRRPLAWPCGSSLATKYPVDRIMPANDWRELLSVEIADLGDYDLFQGHFSFGLMDLLPADVDPGGFLRDPVARTISHLKHMRRDPSFSQMGYRLAAGARPRRARA